VEATASKDGGLGGKSTGISESKRQHTMS